MPLTKKDLSQIKGVIHNEVELAVEILAAVVNKSFSAVQKQIELLDKKVELVEKEIQQINVRLKHIEARLDTIEHDIADIRRHFVYRDEFEEVVVRLAAIEKKLGIRSGK